MGVWIETGCSVVEWTLISVTPHVGVWIETMMLVC